MKERPILFSAPMVRAILEGRKTQTRRIVPEAEHGKSRACRYGAIGDRLWVRETHCVKPFRLFGEEPSRPEHCLYRADNTKGTERFKWTPAIHMFRWASRITLEITGVRVERLNGINTADARAEGFPEDLEEMADKHEAYPIAWYVALWESINGADSWFANPWVWVIEFKRVQP